MLLTYCKVKKVYLVDSIHPLVEQTAKSETILSYISKYVIMNYKSSNTW